MTYLGGHGGPMRDYGCCFTLAGRLFCLFIRLAWCRLWPSPLSRVFFWLIALYSQWMSWATGHRFVLCMLIVSWYGLRYCSIKMAFFSVCFLHLHPPTHPPTHHRLSTRSWSSAFGLLNAVLSAQTNPRTWAPRTLVPS